MASVGWLSRHLWLAETVVALTLAIQLVADRLTACFNLSRFDGMLARLTHVQRWPLACDVVRRADARLGGSYWEEKCGVLLLITQIST